MSTPTPPTPTIAIGTRATVTPPGCYSGILSHHWQSRVESNLVGTAGRCPSAGCARLVTMTEHRITFEGPPSVAVRVATVLADADGVDLTGQTPEPGGTAERVVLVLTVDGTVDDVAAAVAAVEADLPPGATVVHDLVGDH